MKDPKEKRKIAKEIKFRLKCGHAKQKILEDVSQMFKDKVFIVKQLEKTPSEKMKSKYFIHNIILSLLLLLAITADLITFTKLDLSIQNNWIMYFTALNIVLDIIFWIGVKLYRVETYSWIASRALVSLIVIITSYMYYYQTVDYLVYVSLCLVSLSFVFGLWLGVHLCPPRVPKCIEVKINKEEMVEKVIYVFPD